MKNDASSQISNKIIVRKYHKNDLPILRELELSSENFGKPFLDSEMRFIERDSNPKFGGVFVAEIEGEIVGYIALSKNIFSVVIDSIVVRDDMKRKGIGTALIEKARDYTRNSKFEILRVDTGDFMDYAINFYLKAGFRPCGFVIHDWGLNTKQLHFYTDLSK